MINLFKYELLNRRLIFLIASVGVFIVYAIIPIACQVLDLSFEFAIAMTSIVFAGATVLIIHNPIASFRRDFQHNSKYLIFSIPIKPEKFLISRILTIAFDLIFYVIVCLFPYIYVIYAYISATENIVFLGFPSSNLSLAIYFIINFIFFALLAYFSIAVTKSFSLRKLGIFVPIATVYILCWFEFFVMLMLGFESNSFVFFHIIQLNASDTFAMTVYFSLKILEVVTLFYLTSKLFKNHINI